MDEFKFVMKCLIVACLLFSLSQYRTDDGFTVESRVHTYLVSSSIAGFVNESARGAVKLVRKGKDEAMVYFDKSEPKKKSKPVKNENQVDTEDIDLE